MTTTITVSIFDEERGDTTISREINLSPKVDNEPTSSEEAAERRMHRQIGVANRLTDVSREVAILAAALHLI